jgi:hypothetical protein
LRRAGRLVIVTSTQNPWHTRRFLGWHSRCPSANPHRDRGSEGDSASKQHIHVEPTSRGHHEDRQARAARPLPPRSLRGTFIPHEMRVKVRHGEDQNGMLRAIVCRCLQHGAYGDTRAHHLLVAAPRPAALQQAVAVRFGGHVGTRTRCSGSLPRRRGHSGSLARVGDGRTGPQAQDVPVETRRNTCSTKERQANVPHHGRAPRACDDNRILQTRGVHRRGKDSWLGPRAPRP